MRVRKRTKTIKLLAPCPISSLCLRPSPFSLFCFMFTPCSFIVTVLHFRNYSHLHRSRTLCNLVYVTTRPTFLLLGSTGPYGLVGDKSSCERHAIHSTEALMSEQFTKIADNAAHSFSHLVASQHIALQHITSHHKASHGVTSQHITSHRTTWPRTASRHTTRNRTRV